MQNKEDTIFTRMQQLDASFIREFFIMRTLGSDTTKPFTDSKNFSNAQTAAEYFAQFILSFVCMASEEIGKNYNSLSGDCHKAEVVMPLMETLLMLVTYVAKSGTSTNR